LALALLAGNSGGDINIEAVVHAARMSRRDSDVCWIGFQQDGVSRVKFDPACWKADKMVLYSELLRAEFGVKVV
jgi:hypothetical protein